MNETLRKSVDRLRRENPTLGIKYAVQIARDEAREPKYSFLAEIRGADDYSQGEVDGLEVEVKVVRDEDTRLGEDDVTGWFTDEYSEGCIKNRRFGYGNGDGFTWYRPSNYDKTELFSDYRRAGQSKSVALDLCRERIKRAMVEDHNREYLGVKVSVSFAGETLGEGSLWGIDIGDGANAHTYLWDVAEELIADALEQAWENLPDTIKRVEGRLVALRQRHEEKLAKLRELAEKRDAQSGGLRASLRTLRTYLTAIRGMSGH